MVVAGLGITRFPMAVRVALTVLGTVGILQGFSSF